MFDFSDHLAESVNHSSTHQLLKLSLLNRSKSCGSLTSFSTTSSTSITTFYSTTSDSCNPPCNSSCNPSCNPSCEASLDAQAQVQEEYQLQEGGKIVNPLTAIEFGERVSDGLRVIFKSFTNPHHLQREVEALEGLSNLCSPHLVQLLSIAPGGRLVFPRLNPLPQPMAGEALDNIVRLTQQLLLALSQMHQAGWAHLDVNPNNLMLSGSGELVLIDFGLARRLNEQQLPCGTAGYIAPELWKGPVNDARLADIFSVGVVLGEWIAPYFPAIEGRLSVLGSRYAEAGETCAGARTALLDMAIELKAGQLCDLARLAAGMLGVDPKQRPTAMECLESAVFGYPASGLTLSAWLSSSRRRQRRWS